MQSIKGEDFRSSSMASLISGLQHKH